MKKITIFLLILVLLFCSSCVSGIINRFSYTRTTEPTTTTSTAKRPKPEDGLPVVDPDFPDYASQNFYGDQLTGDERTIYNGFVHYAKNNLDYSDFVIGGLSENRVEISKPLISAYYDYPDLFYLSGTASAVREEGSENIVISDYYNKKWQLLKEKQEKLDIFNEKLDEIVALANQKSTDYEKALFVHDYIIDNTVYDYVAESGDPEDYIYSNTAYSCLVDGRTICEGFAMGYKAVLDRLGIECVVIIGGNHGWNAVKLDGEYHIVDITYDNCSYYDKDPATANKYKRYTYFGLSQDEYFEVGSWTDLDVTFPECNGTKYNYFKYEGYFVEEYSFYEVLTVCEKQKNSRIVSIKFENLRDYNQAYKELITDRGVFDIPSLANEKLSTLCYEEDLLIMLYKK